MIYYAGYLPPEEFQVFYEHLIRDISQKFQLEKLSKKRRIPHVTLKSPFEISSVQSLDKLAAGFCQRQKSSEISINGIGNFGKEVIFLRSHLSRQARDMFKEFLDSLKTLREINWSEYDAEDRILHITFVKGEELEGKFNDVYTTLSSRDIRFVLPFDNITIFQKDGERTSVYRTHYFGG
ncbi:MAG: 2'-5' RNA ligase family protein [Nanoarchaeota archaeon]|nr:2'-5' RNA ligase family protein [Nanoarchaeota archaeon]